MSAGVNRPTDTKQKEQDINQKLQLYGIYQAFKCGKLPSNKQCDIALNSALASKALSSPSKELSSEGQVLVTDLRHAIEQAKKLILSKNEGQLLQEFIWEAEHITADDIRERPDVPLSKDLAEQDGRQALEGLKALGNLLITNGEFRKLLNDAWILARDIAGDASQKAANQLRPSEEQLAQIDEPAEENVWHEKPDFAKHKENLTSRFKTAKSEKQYNEIGETAVQAATGDQDPETAGDIDIRAGATAGAEEVNQRLSGNVSEDTKSRAREYTDRTKNYLAQKVPPERREQAIWRLKKMVLEIQGHANYQQAIQTLLNLVEKYGSTTRHISEQGAGAVKGIRGGSKVQAMETNLRVLIERFANSTSLDDFFDSLETIYQDADKDPELKGWFKNINTFIRKCLQEQGYIMQEGCDRQWNQLAEHGQYLLRERYKDHTNRVLDEVKFIGAEFSKDPQNKAFADSMDKLFHDLGRDSVGNVAFKKHLLKDVRDVILPATFEKIRYVPIPRIEVSDPMADVVIENLVIESDNLMPNVVEFGSDNYFRWGRKKISNKHDNKIMISVSGIQADLRDVSYYVKKKQGFPSITDTGVMDIFLGGDGFGFKIAASTAHKADRQNFIKLDKVVVKISDLDIKLKKSKHKILFSIFKPLLFRTVRPVLQKVLQQQIRDAFARGDNFAYEIYTEVQRGKEATLEDPKDAPNVYARYINALRARMDEKKRQQVAQETAERDTKVQTATTLHDSLFPDIHLPGGISSKATEYKELSQKGERWESPIFTIGSASESSDIPNLAEIRRKPHSRSKGRLADGGLTNGTMHAVDGTAKYNGSHGFSDEMDQAFSNGATSKTGPTIPGADSAFNPQAA
ncbi:hypothetical protein EYZ11_001477 [Aspergillus tanneri]|uniref:Uncharacterized protein n=1 Tax=Aspergillus tanneri TaxID=1220188 RepID=A0A4S3JUM5_9EURO|nr:hypothetical protein EYZ11_001477 [Aspergillus tanneri]